MPQVDKKYLDLEGLQALVDKHALVVHEQKTPANAAPVQVGQDANGHVILGNAITPAVIGAQVTLVGSGSGQNIKTVGGNSLLGSGDISFKTINNNSILGSGDISLSDLGLSGAMHFKGVISGSSLPATTNYNEGDVIILGGTGKEYVLALNGTNGAKKWNELGDESSHALKTIKINAGTGLTGGGTLEADRTISLAEITGGAITAAPLKIGRDAYGRVISGGALTATAASDGAHTHTVTGNVDIAASKVVTGLNPTSTGYSWSLNKGTSNANLSSVALRSDDQITYGNANLGSNVSIWGLKVSSGNLQTTTASKATQGTAVAVATTGTPVVYGTADVGTAVTGLAKRGDSITYGNANYGSEISIWGLASSEGTLTTVKASKATAGTAKDVASAGTAVVYGKANCKSTTTTVATKASTPTTVGNANYNATATTVATGLSGTAYSASYDSTNEKLTLTALTVNTTGIHEATSSSTAIYGCGDNATIQEAVAAPSTQTIVPAVANGTITPYTFADVTVPVAAESTNTFRPATVSSSTTYGCTSASVSITPAVAADTTRKVTPAVANGSITPYTFTDITVPIAATAITTFTPAAESSSKAYVCKEGTASVFNSGTTVSVSTPSSGAQATLITAVAPVKEAVTSAGSISGGSAASNGAHTHTVNFDS